MKSNITKLLLLAVIFTLSSLLSKAQTVQKKITVEELFALTRQNHPNLKVSEADVDIAEQEVAVAKSARLPSLGIGVQAYHLGNALMIDKNFSHSSKVNMPHFGNSLAFEANQLIWKGNTVGNSIKIQSLKEDLMQLNYESNEQNIKLLVLGYYLDLYKLMNQESVYEKNIDLAKQRLNNINKLYKEGMVTRNDVIRGELQISNLQLALESVQNNHIILNKQLTVALGLPDETQIIPDESVLGKSAQVFDIEGYRFAGKNHPSIAMAKKSVDIYDVSEKIIKADRVPALSLFTGNQLQRPVTTATPALDMYSNGWSAGVSLNWNLDAFYKSPKKLQLNKYEKRKAEARQAEAEQMIEIAIDAAYIKYKEAVSQNNTFHINKNLAGENYRIMESKYNNQLAILLDLIDASNAKLDAELQYTNSRANIVFSYYKLLKESGQL